MKADLRVAGELVYVIADVVENEATLKQIFKL
jgi:hypothetical protein